MTSTAASSRRSPVAKVAVLGVLGLLVLAVVTAYALFDNRVERGALDPDSPAPDGSRALAVLLENHGVTVDEADRSADALDTAEDGEVTVVVPFAYFLSERTIRALDRLPPSVRVVFVEPDDGTLALLDLDVVTVGGSLAARDVEPGCALPEARSAGSAEAAQTRYRVDEDRATTCYERGLVVVDRPGRAELVLLGADDPLTNERLARSGNAALSLGLLSEHRRVVWLLAFDPAAGEERPGLFDLLPDWVVPAAWLLVAAALLAALWRGRRLGPPVAEPLPVVVRAAETVEGRARLYRRARARSESFAALRAATLAQLLPALGLGPAPPPRAVVQAVAERSGWTMDQVYGLLYGPPPADDPHLVTAADAFDTLVRDTVGPGTTPRRPDDKGHLP